MTYHGINIPREALALFCRRHHIRRLSLFGSILREDFRPDSDIDILVEFEEGRLPSLLEFAHMELELTERLGRSVDLRTAEDLSKYFRDAIVRTAKVQYAA